MQCRVRLALQYRAAVLQAQLHLHNAQLDMHAHVLVRRGRRRQRRRWWSRAWLSPERRRQFGLYDQLMVELRREDCDSNFARKLPLFAFPIIWNNWSPKLPFTVSEACVKKLIKSSLINSYAESIKCQNSRCRDCYI